MILEKPKLFTQVRHFIIFALAVLTIISLRLAWQYHTYSDFIQKPFYYTNALVVNSYPKSKNGKTYTILKLRTGDQRTIYTTTYRHDDFTHKKIYIKLMPSRQISFWDYLGGMYCKSKIKRIEPAEASVSSRLEERIASEHTDKDMQSFYKAIFLASPVPKELRQQIASLGVSHLVALSGFHLGILWGALFGIFLFLYRPFQQKYFPYRYSLVDVGLVVMLLLGYYLWLTDFPPSLVRSFTMMLVGWIMVLMGIELISFTFLSTITLVLLAIFPALVVSLSFWLSVAGVFYIFLLLQYCKNVKGWLISFVCIPIGIFILMQPVVHYFFGLTTPYQLLSPVLSILFIVFYPVAFAIHLIGQGSLLDNSLIWLFALPIDSNITEEKLMPLWGLGVYVMLSVGAIWSRRVFYLLLAVAVGYVVLELV